MTFSFAVPFFGAPRTTLLPHLTSFPGRAALLAHYPKLVYFSHYSYYSYADKSKVEFMIRKEDEMGNRKDPMVVNECVRKLHEMVCST